VPRESVAPRLLAKTFRVIPHASEPEIPARVSSAHSVADVIEIAAAVDVPTAAADVPIAVAIVVQTVGAQAARDSNAVRAVPVVRATIVVTAIPVRRADLN
jgi:hypothetical protein